jgi:hypothetical protein
MSQEAGRELRAFIWEFGHVMDVALEEGRAGLSERLREDMQVLWREVQTHISEIDAELAGVEQGENEELQGRLDRAGLDGEPLRIKLRLFRDATRNFDDAAAMETARDIWSRLRPVIVRSRWGRVAGRFATKKGKRRATVKKRAFRSVLRWANPILGSLAAVIPPVAGVKEVKELVEAGVDEEIDEPDAPAGAEPAGLATAE